MYKIFLLWLFIFSLSFSASADKITIRADVWCPYNCEPGSELPGYMIEITRAIFEKVGHKIEYKALPWARAIKQTREGHFNAIVGAYIDDAPDFLFPESLGVSEMVFYGKKDQEWKYSGFIDSVKKIKLGAIKDYAYSTKLDEYIASKKSSNNVQLVHGKSPLESNIKKLLAGRVDILVVNKDVFKYMLLKTGRLNESFKHCGILDTSKVHVAFSPKNKKSPIYVKIFNRGLKELKVSGRLQKILSKYGISSWR